MTQPVSSSRGIIQQKLTKTSSEDLEMNQNDLTIMKAAETEMKKCHLSNFWFPSPPPHTLWERGSPGYGPSGLNHPSDPVIKLEKSKKFTTYYSIETIHMTLSEDHNHI